MDHAYIEEHGLIDLYHRGQLPLEEEAGFEEHFVGCPDCQQRLQMARGFQRGLKTAVAEDVAKAGLLAWLVRRRWIALAALVVAAILPILGYLAGSRGATPMNTE
ncbi:MAG TPA: zf-HC2 domain-containing protein, partial [Thermoanaerobaculia bacterium]|nr:zf-HC2 domain-containing protein [Thermoanaerobaculia bacterium]